ncbi:MAG: hypothetical protein JWM93_135 [Frankiales bacterium]|nr:hypothetical protein [Frankiales bacterium]
MRLPWVSETHTRMITPVVATVTRIVVTHAKPAQVVGSSTRPDWPWAAAS